MVDNGALPFDAGLQGVYRSRAARRSTKVICHGIPDSTVVADGDIVNIDVTAYIDGGARRHETRLFLAGDVSEEHRPARRTNAGKRRCVPSMRSSLGGRCPWSGRVIESYANRFGYNVVRDFTGSRLSATTFHNGLVVLHYDQPAVDTIMQPGNDLHHRADDQTWVRWTTRSGTTAGQWSPGNRKWTAQFEHNAAGHRHRRSRFSRLP